jgi:hypothetical protein
MAVPLATVGQKITATIWNVFVTAFNTLLASSGVIGVIPTSVAVGSGSGSVGTLGKVTFTGASSVSVNGAFTTTYDVYKILIDIPTTSATCTLVAVLRAAGTDATSANYDIQVIQGTTSTAAAAAAAAGASWGFNGGTTGTLHFITVELSRPALASPTLGFETAFATQNPATAPGMAVRGLSHRLSTAYDGFTITAAGGTITGTIRIHGYNNLT